MSAVIALGGASGASAAAPAVGTRVGLIVNIAEVGAFFEASALFCLAVADVHGVQIVDLERRRTLLMGVLMGNGGSRVVEKVAGRTGTQWAKSLVKAVPMAKIDAVNNVLGPRDATNIAMRIERDGDEYVLNGRKWWTTGALHPNCRILITMGKTDPQAAPYQQQSMVLVPLDTPGVTVERSTTVFGYTEPEGHGVLRYEDVRVPVENIIAGEGMGFLIAQARLGPGRVHHCMRAIGAAERALELMCARADARETFGRPVSHNANVRDWIAESRIEIEMARLLVMKTAWLMDTVGNQHARTEIAGIKFAVPQVCLRVVDRAIQVHGGGGVSDDFPLAMMYAGLRSLRLADGPDEVHKLSVARQELRRQRERRDATRS